MKMQKGIGNACALKLDLSYIGFQYYKKYVYMALGLIREFMVEGVISKTFAKYTGDDLQQQ